jgi:hypothetical protein
MQSGIFVVAGAMLVVAASCASFEPSREADDAGANDSSAPDAGDSNAACPAETCDGRTQCTLYDFTNGCGDWTTGGDGEVHECTNGKLRIKAANTLDSTAMVTLPTPSGGYTIHIAARIAFTDWDGGHAFRVRLNGETYVLLTADRTIGDTVQVKLCRSDTFDCAPIVRPLSIGAEHLLVVEMTTTGILAFVDCDALGKVGQAPLPPSGNLELTFGKNDGAPIEGTLDDVVVQYRQ